MAKLYTVTESTLRRILNAVRRVEAMPFSGGGGRGAEGNRPHVEKFLAVITGNASLATNRWKYAWSEVLPNGDLVSTRSGGRSGTTSSGYATNLSEMYHTSTYAWGVDTTGTDYPSGFAPRPVGGGGTANTHRYNVPVEMTQVTDPSGNVKYYFWAMGSHDGTCT